MNTPIHPSRVPSMKLISGDSIPAVGLGTFGSDKYSADQIAAAVSMALELGYRHIDCAEVYGNEVEIGRSLRQASMRGIPRREIWITGKVWNNHHGDGEVLKACEQSLKNLQLDYFDLYLVHWPFPNHHAAGVDVGSRDPHAVPYDHARFLRTWRQMEALVKRGLVRNIGTSNMSRGKLRKLLADAHIRPVANEMELHPHFQQPDLLRYIQTEGILPIAFSPFGSPSRPERDRTPQDSSDLTDPVIIQIARERGISPAAVAIRWAIQRGHVPIPFSVKPEQFGESLAAACLPQLSHAHMAALSSIDRNCRLIKGQVFLWPEARSWEELWIDAD